MQQKIEAFLCFKTFIDQKCKIYLILANDSFIMEVVILRDVLK